MITATWKMEGMFKADAQKVAEEILAIGDEATPEQIVDAARDANSELHRCFDWNNDTAAEKWRKQQARSIMHFLVIETKTENEENKQVPIRFFYKTDNGGYKPSSVVFKKADEYQALLQRAYAELHAFKIKYAMLQELEEILALID